MVMENVPVVTLQHSTTSSFTMTRRQSLTAIKMVMEKLPVAMLQQFTILF